MAPKKRKDVAKGEDGSSKVAKVDGSAKKRLAHEQLLAQMQQIMESNDSTELAIVHLMLEYSFNSSDLRRVLSCQLITCSLLSLL